MTDVLTKEQRSYCMSRIKSRWTKPEKIIHNYLKGNKIRHKMHPNMPGNPDIFIFDSNTVVFIHGCFWHKCPKCFKPPESNTKYWNSKIERNVMRDRKNKRKLKRMGIKIITIWEHEINNKDTEMLHNGIFR